MPPLGTAPALAVDVPDAPVRAIAVVLHGGRSHSGERVRPGQFAVLRMLPFAKSLRRAGAADGLVVARLRYAVRGWNGDTHAPVADVQWALGRLDERFPSAPVALIGHSMGGRAALYAAGQHNVRAVVGLAPWIEPGDPVAPLAGRRVLIAHGSRDRTTSASASAAYAREASAVAESVSYVSVHDDGHAMLRRARVWQGLTTGFVTGLLLERPYPPNPKARSDDTTNIVAKALAGQASLVV